MPIRLLSLALFSSLVLAAGACSSSSDDAAPDDASTNDASGEVRAVSQQEVVALAGAGKATLLDVRSVSEFESGHVPGAMNIPIDELAGRLDELESAEDGEIIVYCEAGGRAGKATTLLAEAGFPSLGQLEGDMSAWRAAGLDTEP